MRSDFLTAVSVQIALSFWDVKLLTIQRSSYKNIFFRLCFKTLETGVYKVLVGKPEGKRPLGRSRHRWEDNLKMDLQEVG